LQDPLTGGPVENALLTSDEEAGREEIDEKEVVAIFRD
jgi:hypothetical protein